MITKPFKGSQSVMNRSGEGVIQGKFLIVGIVMSSLLEECSGTMIRRKVLSVFEYKVDYEGQTRPP